MGPLLGFLTSVTFLAIAIFAILSLQLTLPPRNTRAWITAVLWVLMLVSLLFILIARQPSPRYAGPTVTTTQVR